MISYIKSFWITYKVGLEVQRYILDCMKISKNPDITLQRSLIAKFLEGNDLEEFSRNDFIQYVINYGKTLAYLDTSKVIRGIKNDF